MEVSNSEAACGGVGGGKWGLETTGKQQVKRGRSMEVSARQPAAPRVGPEQVRQMTEEPQPTVQQSGR